MRLSMHMITDQLSGILDERHLTNAAQKLSDRTVLPYPESGKTTPGNIYLCDVSKLSSTDALNPACFYLFLGALPPALRNSSLEYAHIKDGVSFITALTEALDAQNTYLEWHRKLTDELLYSRNLNHLCQICSELVEHNVLIYDRTYEIIGIGIHEESTQLVSSIKKSSAHYTLSADELNSIVQAESFQKTFSARGASVYDDLSSQVGDTKSLFVNLNQGRKYEGRVVILYRHEPIPESAFQIIEVFTEIVRLALRAPSTQNNELDQVFRVYLASLLEGRATEGRQLDDSLRLWGWTRQANYLCLRANLTSTALDAKLDKYLASQVEQQLPGSCALAYKNGIAAVVSLDEQTTYTGCLDAFSQVIGKNGQTLGASSVFTDILDGQHYYQEACIACHHGSPQSDSPTTVAFPAIALAHYHRFGTSKLDASHFCDPAVQALLPYRGTRTDFYHILKTYLEHNMNLLHTSEALFVHRTTLFKYLKQIRAITGADLDDLPTRMRMLMSFQIMQQENE